MRIYLIGGYFTQSNYGDVIQARVWVDFYNELGFRPIFVHSADAEKLKEFRAFLGEEVDFIHGAEVLQGAEKLRREDLCHLYGGGHLNARWGDIFLELIKRFSAGGATMISTGTQLDEAWAAKYRREMGELDGIDWISVRDEESRNLVEAPYAILCDDSLLHFLDAPDDGALPPRDGINLAKAVLIHFNVSDYAINNVPTPGQPMKRRTLWDKLAEKIKGKNQRNGVDRRSAQLEEIVWDYLSGGYRVTVLRNFSEIPDGAVEAERIVRNKELRSRIAVTDTAVVEESGGTFEFGIASSYHAAIMMRVRLGIPVYFLALNDYYDQKAAALVEYGLIDESRILRSLEGLKELKPLEMNESASSMAFDELSERVTRVKNRVLEVVTWKEAIASRHSRPRRAVLAAS